MTTVPTTFVAGNTVSASTTNANNNALAAAIDDIATGNIRDNAAIVSTQLADRYTLYPLGPFVIVPFAQQADWTGAMTAYNIPAAATTIVKHQIRVPAGKRAWLAYLEVHVIATTTGGGGWAQLTALLGSTTLGGAAKVLNATGYHTIGNSDPVADPLIALNDLDDLELQIGSSAGTPTARGITVVAWIKEELTS